MFLLKYSMLFSILMDVIYCHIHLVYEKQSRYRHKVVQGMKANIAKHPYLISITQTKKTGNAIKCVCGGTILNQRWILTAGHCIFQDSNSKTLYAPNKLEVLVGSSKCSLDGQIMTINKIVSHPNYQMSFENDYFIVNSDIGLIQLSENLIYTQNIRPVRLLYPKLLKNQLPVKIVGYKCTAMGWGLLEEHAHISPKDLYDVNLPLMQPELCANALKSYNVIINVSNSICTLDPNGTRDVCTGDSGGPLMCKNYQVGIVSGSLGCARKNMPNLWTRVDVYYDWIQSVIETKLKNRQLKNNVHKSNIFLYIYVILSIFEIYFI